MRQYLELIDDILDRGQACDDRTGVGTIAVFGYQMRFDLSEGFPLVTTKKLHLRSVVHELLWFLRGETNVQRLHENNVTIWDEWANEAGDLGPIYGRQWRAWPGPDGREIDQITWLIDEIRQQPSSRRLLVSAWNVAELNQMALVPCHVLWQVSIIGNRLSLQLYQRSADVFLGLPFNIASYALLLHMLAQQCGFEPGEFIWTGGDCHIYRNHLDQVRLQRTRQPYPLPELRIKRHPASIVEYDYADFEFANYRYHPPIKGEVAV